MFALTVVTIGLFLSRMNQAVSANNLKEHEKLILDRQGLQNVTEVHKNWYFYSIKALLGQLAKELLGELNSSSRERLKLCLKRIVYTKDLRKTATCLLKARERWKKHLKYKGSRETDDKVPTVLQGFRGVKPARFPHWLRIHRLRARRIKRSPVRLVLPNNLRDNDHEVRSLNFVPPLREPPSKSAVHRVANLFVSLFGKTRAEELPEKWSTTYKSILKLSKYIDNNENSPGTRVYNTRIYDLVMDSGDVKQRSEINIPPFLQHAFDIVKSFNGAKNARVLSPRFAPLLPDKTTAGILSPSIFPFYKDDTEQQILPVPKMLEFAGMNEKDRERVLEMIMEVSGARDTVDKAMRVLKHLGMDDELLSGNEIIGKAFEQLQSSFTRRQNKELNRRGFTFMNPKQIDELHEKQNVTNPEIRQQLLSYKKLPKSKREELLWQSIGELAGLNSHRRKRQAAQINLVSTLRPTILSPYQFAPVYGLTVIGPVILSPNLFAPLILNPSLLSPWVLSPAFPLPFILSPYVFSPYVLSPLAMAPFVFSPYVLSPNVINPYVLSPVILSPIVVCPDILSPMTLGGIILSPNVLSPSILSKSYLMTSILSPSLLS